MYYIKWTAQEIEGLAAEGIDTLWTEVDADGHVIRELGFSDQGKIVHRAPSEVCRFGYFDNQVVDVSNLTNSVDEVRFLESWSSPMLGD